MGPGGKAGLARGEGTPRGPGPADWAGRRCPPRPPDPRRQVLQVCGGLPRNALASAGCQSRRCSSSDARFPYLPPPELGQRRQGLHTTLTNPGVGGLLGAGGTGFLFYFVLSNRPIFLDSHSATQVFLFAELLESQRSSGPTGFLFPRWGN